MYYVRTLSIGWILNSKTRNKLIRFKKGNEHIYYENLTHVRK